MLREGLLAAEAGIGIGALYGLVALGYTLILASCGVFNLVQGALVVAGSMVMLGLWQILGWPILAVAAVALLGGAIVGLVTYLISVLPLARFSRGSDALTEGTLVTTFAVWLILGTIITLTFGNATVAVNSYVPVSGISIGGIPIQPIYIVMVGITLVIIGLFEFGVRRTSIGLVLRATVEDTEGARLAGVSVTRVVMVSFATAGALAAIAGILIAPVTFASPYPNSDLAFYGFAAMAIGGFGSFTGAIVGGFIVGILTNVPALWVNSNYMSLIVYGAMLLVLWVRPAGLFGVAGSFGSAKLREL